MLSCDQSIFVKGNMLIKAYVLDKIQIKVQTDVAINYKITHSNWRKKNLSPSNIGGMFVLIFVS